MERVRPADPASKATRAVVRRYLDAAVDAARRLSDSGDLEALHDCRVALRRLRVALKAYAPALKPGMPKELRRALGALTEHTGPARDAEVFVEWLSGRVPRLRPPARGASEWLLRRVSDRRDAAYKRLRLLIPKALGMIEPLLRAGLASRGSGASGATKSATFGQLTARCVEEQLAELEAALRKIGSADDHERAHRARIAAKKVRYLLEPAFGPRGAGILKPLKVVQDRLGEFHDLGGVKMEIEKARRWRGRIPEGGPTREALASLARVLSIAERQRRSLFRRIDRDFLRGSQRWLVPVKRWIARQRAAATPPRPAVS